MNKKGILLSISVIFIFSTFLIFSLFLIPDLRAEQEDIGEAAYKQMKEAEKTEDEGNIEEAVLLKKPKKRPKKCLFKWDGELKISIMIMGLSPQCLS
ncbi:MAG: hypothetical protein ACQERH_09300 [Acidobacteriota bacterium]